MRHRKAALTDTAGVYHVASRLAFEGFHTAVARGGTSPRVNVFASLPSISSSAAALLVRTTDCSSSKRSDRGKEAARRCEWHVGKKAALTNDPALFVALVDLKRMEGLPAVYVFPSARVYEHFTSVREPKRRWRYGPSEEELASYENNWDILEDYLRRGHASRTGWVIREELEQRYGEEFLEELDAEASRLLRAENSTVHQVADERFSAEELAEASALLRVLFRRWMEGVRQRKTEKGGRGA